MKCLRKCCTQVCLTQAKLFQSFVEGGPFHSQDLGRVRLPVEVFTSQRAEEHKIPRLLHAELSASIEFTEVSQALDHSPLKGSKPQVRDFPQRILRRGNHTSAVS